MKNAELGLVFFSSFTLGPKDYFMNIMFIKVRQIGMTWQELTKTAQVWDRWKSAMDHALCPPWDGEER